MVFKPISRLASQSSKTFTHGYAQSVVAATQSSYASTTTPFGVFSGNHGPNRFGRPGTAHAHHTFQHVPNSSGASNSSGLAGKAIQTTSEGSEDHGDLNAYYANAFAEQQHNGGEAKEWKQFQFPKRIGWKAPSGVPDGKGKDQLEVDALSANGLPKHADLERSYSTSAVDDIKESRDAAEDAEKEAIAVIDGAVANEISDVRQAAALKDQATVATPSTQTQAPIQALMDGSDRATTPSSQSPRTLVESSPSTSLQDVTRTTSPQDADAQAHFQHISQLQENQAYSQIPAVFESMLNHGIRPTAEAYNALLQAAIHLPSAKHQVVPKALDVYADMLRRKVASDTTFYDDLLQLLCRRALEVFKTKAVLNQKKLRFGGLEDGEKYLFPSNEAEYAIVCEDDALTNAIGIFKRSMSSGGRSLSPETYRLIVTATAMSGFVDEMVQAYTHMEQQKVKPSADMFPLMIEALAKSGDLNSAIEVYNEYKSLAIASDARERSMNDRQDNEVYAAVVKAYAICGKIEGGHRFNSKIVDSYANVTEHRKERLEAVQNAIVLNALVEDRIAAKDFSAALRIVEERNLTTGARTQAMARVCAEAADHGDASLATKAYEYLSPAAPETTNATLALLSLHVRLGQLTAASKYWNALGETSLYDTSFVEPVTLYVQALVRGGEADEGLTQAREAFGRIRASAQTQASKKELSEQIDEAIELITTLLATSGTQLSPNARMSLLWAMMENGGIISPSAEQMLAGLGPHDIMGLSWQNIVLALQVEAGLLGAGEGHLDIAHSARFAHLLGIAMDSQIPLDERSVGLIDCATEKLCGEHPDLLRKWHSRLQSSRDQVLPQQSYTPLQAPPVPVSTPYADTFDPYAKTTDYRGSTIIAEELETRRNAAGLNEALVRFRNIRRAGRHPRYIAYAKLITAAAKEGRTNLTLDILGMARTDMPFQPEFAVVRHGWALILDAMLGACLTAGRRPLAEQYHQELLEIGAAPTANTFGLYITTLKESTKTFDEATEAVSVFNRAISEGVVPSSFLYNALIGKLGKARRIDDCLRYFQEMRNAGIRPTSVTYGTIVNALCRVSDERFAEELFDEMESMPNYKPRPAPYNSLMQFFLTTKRDASKVLAYYERMQSGNIQPTMHTYKLLIDTYATLEPVNLVAAEGVLDTIRSSGQRPEAVHYASLIHAKGCVLHDMEGAREVFDQALRGGEVRPQACLYQALFESMVANHCVAQTEAVLESMSANRVEMTPYIANTLIHGWATEKMISKSKAVYDSVGLQKREPSTYEAMTRAFLTVEDRDGALTTVHEMLSRGYPSAVSNKILELVGHGMARASTSAPSNIST